MTSPTAVSTGLGAQFPIDRLLATGARKASLVGRRNGELQQLGERGRARPMHGRAHDSLHGFQVYESRLAAALENHLQKLFYFPRDLGLDRLRRFFSSGVSVSSTERARQISRFTATKSRLNSR